MLHSSIFHVVSCNGGLFHFSRETVGIAKVLCLTWKDVANGKNSVTCAKGWQKGITPRNASLVGNWSANQEYDSIKGFAYMPLNPSRATFEQM